MSNTTDTKKLFTVVYAQGGYANATWHRALLATPDRKRAEQVCKSEVKSGRPAYVKSLWELETIGMPEGPAPGWDYHNLRWK